MTINQYLKYRKIKRQRCSVPLLRGGPQRRGICDKFVIKSPKKPHSARRKTVRVKTEKRYSRLYEKRVVYCYITGIGYNLNKFSKILFRGGRRRDIPGMRYTLIRGVYDFRQDLVGRVNARSKYGLRREHVRRFYK